MRRLLIDTDCGTDDACAILLAVRAAQKETDLRIEAITTCNGNVPLAKVRPNVLRVLKLCDATEIPVFEGVGRPLVEPYKERRVHLHGNDGFGGISDLYPAAEIQVPEEHAANAMVRLAREFKDELSVVALGPLTNVALAQKLDPKFFSNIKELFVLGGSIVGSGKEPPGPGFNFTCDPEAVSIVVNESEKAEKLTIVSMEACRNYPLEWTWFESLDKSNKYVEFFKKIMGNAEKHWRALAHPGICIYDMTAIAVYLDQRVVAKTLVCPVSTKWTNLFLSGKL